MSIKGGCVGFFAGVSLSSDEFRFLFFVDEDALVLAETVEDEVERAVSRRCNEDSLKLKESFCFSFRICELKTASTVRPFLVTGCASVLNVAEFENIRCTSDSNSVKDRYFGFGSVPSV